MSLQPADPPKGYKCVKCKTFHPYPGYVYAHWDMALYHDCERCRSKHLIMRGKASLVSSPKPRMPAGVRERLTKK